jgi:hypothetical protein
MHNQENRTRSYGANRYPPFLIVKGGIALRNSVRIVENENGSFKANIMLMKVLWVLVLVPLKSHSWPRQRQDIYPNHGCQYICTYIAGATNRNVHGTDTLKSRKGKSVTYRTGGEGGIRTHEPAFGRLPAFEAGSFNRSYTSPRCGEFKD